MMKYKLTISAIILLGILPFITHAQTVFSATGNQQLKVSGTSTLHDWDMISEIATGDAVMVLENGGIQQMQRAKFTMKAESLKSGKNQMDNNAYKALKSKEHPEITFELKGAKKNGGAWEAIGDFSIAGVQKQVVFPLQVDLNGQQLLVKANTTFKLTDFNIDPPTALLGTVKTGDEVTLSIEISLKQSKS